LSVVPLSPDATLQIEGDRLHVHSMEFGGSIVDAIRVLEADQDPQRIKRILKDAVEMGAVSLLHGRNRALVESVAAEINVLLADVTSAKTELPVALQKQLNEYLESLQDALAVHFDARRTSSVQNQLAAMVRGTTAKEARDLMRELLAEDGPLGAMNDKVLGQLRLVSSSNHDVLERVTSLVERLDVAHALDDARERSTQKGASFEDVVGAELEAIFSPLAAEVRWVRHEYGVEARSQAGDFVVALDPRYVGDRDVRVVVEAKTGKLSGPRAIKALDSGIRNREAVAGVLVFDSVDDAPLGGRSFCSYPGGRFIVVLDRQDLNPLALEVACRAAHDVACASVAMQGELDQAWLTEQCSQIAAVIERARDIRAGSNAVRRGADKIDRAYEALRSEALSLLDEIKARLD
jgi:hypothetical protein